MSDSIEWLGDYCFEPPMGAPGMRGGVSLTAVRGLSAEELLQRMGATDAEIGVCDAYRRFDTSTVTAPWTPCMYGTSGEWSYVLEDSGVCAWYQHLTDENYHAMPRKGEELVCLHANVAVQPCWLVYSPGDGSILRAEFRESILNFSSGDGEGKAAHLDRVMRENGAVWPGSQDFESVSAWHEFVERNSNKLPGAVWKSVGECLGITIPRVDVEEGNLPVSLLTDPFA